MNFKDRLSEYMVVKSSTLPMSNVHKHIMALHKSLSKMAKSTNLNTHQVGDIKHNFLQTQANSVHKHLTKKGFKLSNVGSHKGSHSISSVFRYAHPEHKFNINVHHTVNYKKAPNMQHNISVHYKLPKELHKHI